MEVYLRTPRSMASCTKNARTNVTATGSKLKLPRAYAGTAANVPTTTESISMSLIDFFAVGAGLPAVLLFGCVRMFNIMNASIQEIAA